MTWSPRRKGISIQLQQLPWPIYEILSTGEQSQLVYWIIG